MANEATIQSNLQIRIVDPTTSVLQLQYKSNPAQFLGNVSVVGGPSPGVMTVTPNGTDVDLSKLSHPGYVRFMNQDATAYVDVGLYILATGYFFPLFELQPGETYVARFSRNLFEEVIGATTGTAGGTPFASVRIRATNNHANVKVLVEAFES